MIQWRGKPDKGGLVHAKRVGSNGTLELEPVCRNGSAHLFLSSDVNEVNCQKCLEKTKISDNEHNK